MKKFSKIFMIFCVLFSQFSSTLQVLALELVENLGEVDLEESIITVTLDDEYNLSVKSDGSLDESANYDIYLTSSYKYAYDESEISGYNDVKINGAVSVLGSVLNSEEGYVVSVDGIESQYNGEFSLIVEVVDALTQELYGSATVTKLVDALDKFDILVDDELVEDKYIVSSLNKEVKFVSDIHLNSTMESVSYNVKVNENSLLADGSYNVNYDGMLYGTYSYKWNVLVDEDVYLSRDVSVVYDSESLDNVVANAEILTNANTIGVKFFNENAYVANGVSVLDFVESINMPEYNISVVDSSLASVTDGNVSNGMSLVISKDGLVLTYDIAVVGDVNSDSEINFDDVTTMVSDLLANDDLENDYYNASADVNVDGEVNIFDITKTFDALRNGWDNEVLVDEETLLNPVLSSDVTEEVKIGDTITVRFSLNNFGQSFINGLSGQVEYDSDILSLDNMNLLTLEELSLDDELEDNELEPKLEVKYNAETGKFIIYGADYNSEEYLLEVTFTALGASEEEYISISSLTASYSGEEVLLSTDSVSMSFVVTYTSNVGGDESLEDDEENTLVNNVVRPTRVLSADSFLYDLTIDGVEFDFSPYTFSYKLKVGSDVNSLNINATLSDYRASYSVYGNENFKAGENVVTVVVTAEDGSTHTYTLIVEKEEEEEVKKDKDDDKSVKEESNISKTVIVILIVLVIIGLIYLIFKDDEGDNEIKNNKKKD